jgi:hypothetical protein
MTPAIAIAIAAPPELLLLRTFLPNGQWEIVVIIIIIVNIIAQRIFLCSIGAVAAAADAAAAGDGFQDRQGGATTTRGATTLNLASPGCHRTMLAAQYFAEIQRCCWWLLATAGDGMQVLGVGLFFLLRRRLTIRAFNNLAMVFRKPAVELLHTYENPEHIVGLNDVGHNVESCPIKNSKDPRNAYNRRQQEGTDGIIW